ncbi:transposase, partial [Rhizobium aegyptiacum]|uniref:transposase n=1 Tax=Rhizobium aegyptiacum TaxID=1764550 RepID=UPI000ADA7919
ISQSWRRNWEHVVPFFAFPEGVRRIIYTTNAIEALNSKLRRAVRSRGHFPGDEAAMKLLYLVLNNAAEQWKRVSRFKDPHPFSSTSVHQRPIFSIFDWKLLIGNSRKQRPD